MMEEKRPDPESLLKIAKDEDKAGMLKIFFGYAAGVGKTYSMLEAAHVAKKAGIDVCLGYIEPHSRPQTLALMEGLEQIPPLEIKYGGMTLNELDIDAALARRPELILVDELAHTNAPGSRHAKRYLDVEELRKAGIDVYTTVNVQHIESMHDVVEAITKVAVQERIPDKVFDEADQVELIDIEPDDLIERLNKRLVYREEHAKRALENFFTPENLIALRELSLRRMADKVNITVEKNKIQSENEYFTEEHILLGLSGSVNNAKVVRTAARLAEAFHCPLTALYVETSHHADMPKEYKQRLAANIKLAEQLGAKIVHLYGDDIPQLMSEYAKAGSVSKIIIGRPKKSRFPFLRSNFIDKLSALAPNIEIFVIPRTVTKTTKNEDASFAKPLLSHGSAVEALGLSVFFAAVAVLLFVLQWLVAAFVITMIVIFLTVAITGRSRHQARVSSLNAYRTEVLLETSQKLHRARSREQIFNETVLQIIKLLKRTVVLYPSTEHRLCEPTVTEAAQDKVAAAELITPNERGVAEWVYKNNQQAGPTTDTLPSAKCLYVAVKGSEDVLAVIGICMINNPRIDVFEKRLLGAILTECALAIESP